MLNFDPKFIDASDWQVLPWFNSGGTRTKRVLQDNDGNLWYFKCSERKPSREGKPEKYYKYEFWSEIIAYQLGNALGLDVLRYDAAVHNQEIGCISPLMIDQDKEQLVEVGRYMTALNSDFKPDDRSTHHEYSFEFLIETLEVFDLTAYTELFLKTIVFDALIGNTDRHQENWAFISRSSFYEEVMKEVSKQTRHIGIVKYAIDALVNLVFPVKPVIPSVIRKVLKMAPIYDSGSSLGRELNAPRIDTLLADSHLMEQYVSNGKSELHWEKRKISHLEMIAKLISSAYLEQLLDASEFLNNFDEQNARQLVSLLDKDIPEVYKDFCLPVPRKEFIIKLLSLRSQKLKEIISDGRV